MYKVVLIGAGNLATSLGHALKKAGHQVVQVWSRTQESASALASALQAEALTDVECIVKDADVYVFALKDSALESIAQQVCPPRSGGVFLHTAGSMPMTLFSPYASHFGVFYPMQTFSKSRVLDFNEIPVFVEASDEVAETVVTAMAESISEHVTHLCSADRKYLHLAAVFACNFANHCYALSERLLQEHGLPFDVMLPLIDETARKVHHLSPVKAQTGPAVRYDENVIDRQMELLAHDADMQQIYDILSKNIHKLHQ